MSHEFKLYDEEWWPQLRGFIETHWQKGHAVTSSRLFNWQYRGFGPLADGNPKVFLSVHDGMLTGFVGAIPGLFHFQRPDGATEEAGSFAAMWMVLPEYRRSGLGVYLMRHAIKTANIVACLGMNEAAAKVYPALGIQGCLMMDRWVCPLGIGYAQLLKPSNLSTSELSLILENWMDGPGLDAAAAESISADPVLAARLQAGSALSGLKRNEEFYRWRYQQSPGFKYEWWKTAAGLGIVRVETASVSAGHKVLRLIELFAESDRSKADIVRALIARGKKEGCQAVDFQTTHGGWSEALRTVGFRRASASFPETALAEVFRPFRVKASGINIAFRQTPGVSEWSFLKSDGDMDRPNEPTMENEPK